ncbi:ada, partial [Symbiodinium pilosum]
ENVRHAVFDFGAHRVGHGYAMTRDAPGLAEIVREGAHFEVCPTSSLETGAWSFSEAAPPWPQHPLAAMLAAGAKVSINSDDPTVFDTSLTAELLLCLREMKLTREQVVQLTLSAVDAAFGDDEELTRIRRRIEHFATNGRA